MRIRIGWTVLVMLLGLTGWVPAQRPDDVIKVGYVILTSDPRYAPPMVSVIYGNTQSNTETSVLPSGLTNNAAVFISVDNGLGKNTGVAIANPSYQEASVSFTLANSAGEVWTAPQRITISAFSQLSRFITELFPGRIPANFTGSLTISSDTPVGITGLRIRGNNISSVPLVDLTGIRFPIPIKDGVGGPNAVIFPVVVFGGGFDSTMLILNTSPNSVSGRIDIFNPDGTPLSVRLNNQTTNSFNYTIPARGTFIFEN